MSKVGKVLLKGVALGLGLNEDWFVNTIAQDPTELFRIFHYPAPDLTHLKAG